MAPNTRSKARRNPNARRAPVRRVAAQRNPRQTEAEQEEPIVNGGPNPEMGEVNLGPNTTAGANPNPNPNTGAQGDDVAAIVAQHLLTAIPTMVA